MANLKSKDNISMKKIHNSKKRENRQVLLTEFGFKDLKDAKIHLGMTKAKADVVYSVMKDMYNQQVAVAIKHKKSMEASNKYLQNKIKTFYENGQDVKIKKLNQQKLTDILRNIKFGEDGKYRTILNYDNKYLPLTPDVVNNLLKNIDSFWLKEMEAYDTNYMADVVYKIKEINEITLTKPKFMGKFKNEGAFFKYYHNLQKLDLDEFGVFREKQEKYTENCFVQALISLNISDEIIKGVRADICSKYLPTNKLSKLASKYKLYFRIKRIDTTHKDTLNFGNKEDKEVLIGLIDQHYFAIKKVEITSFALKNYFEINRINDYHKIYKKFNSLYKKSNERYISSFDVIEYMYENKEQYLRSIPFDDILDTQYSNEAGEITNLNFAENAVKSNDDDAENSSLIKQNDWKVVFFDFETTTDDLIHKPYLVCNSETDACFGEKCGLNMLQNLCRKFNKTHKRLLLIAHNAGYDLRFIMEYINATSIIERGHTLLEFKGMFYYEKGKFMEIIIRDSYAIISMPLKKFGKCFNLNQSKEILPYSLYNNENIKKKLIPFDDIKKYCINQVNSENLNRMPNDDDYENYCLEFLKNCAKWDCFKDGKIDIIKYSKIYCDMDVCVLKEGYYTFKKLLLESCELDVENFMSSAQLAHNYMLCNRVFDDVYKLSSTPREYIMKCMVGGRTMTAENKQHHIIDELDDFDAVSLYPSSMYRLGGYLKGIPKILENRSYEFLEKQDGYFIQIKVLKVNKKYKFPLMSYINDDGVRTFTNEPKGNLYVCKIDLEDLIKFHQIEFEIIDGYYYNEGRNYELSSVIENVFNERLKMKKLKNPLEQVYKLIMNSSYGKTLQKAIGEEVVFKNQNQLDNFIDKNYNRIKEYEELFNNDNYKRYKIKMEKGVNSHYNNCASGVEVLAMSKRIMNEVMCLAEDNGLNIYYQDTDSIHIKSKDIKILAEKFREVYGRELVGKGMGQFHSDFDSDILKGEIHAVECLFLGKKCYIDKLKGDEDDVFDYHIRMKGIPNSSILYKSKIEGRSVMDIYKSLYEGNPETFDLTCNGEKACFEYNKNYTISTKLKFERTLLFKKEEDKTNDVLEQNEDEEKPNHYIYKWSCSDSNLIYIGSAKNIKKRYMTHIKACNDPTHKHHNIKLYQVIRENGGVNNWKLEQIDAFVANCKKDIQVREQYFIDKLKPSLNMINAMRKEKVKDFNF